MKHHEGEISHSNFKPKCGSQFREDKLVGEGGSEIWKGKYDQVVDKNSYHITNLITKSYNGLLLATNKKTNFEEIATTQQTPLPSPGPLVG